MEDFDPYWTLGETLSWIALRRIEDAHEMAPPGDKLATAALAIKLSVMNPHEAGDLGADWEQSFTKSDGFWGGKIGYMPVSKITDGLMRNARDGRIRVRGKTGPDMDQDIIPPRKLLNLRIHFGPDGLCTLDGTTPVYTDLQFRQSDVKAIWPALGPLTIERTDSQSAGAQKRPPVSKKSLLAWIRQQPSDPLPAIDNLWKVAQAQFCEFDLPRSDFRPAFIEVFGEMWLLAISSG